MIFVVNTIVRADRIAKLDELNRDLETVTAELDDDLQSFSRAKKKSRQV